MREKLKQILQVYEMALGEKETPTEWTIDAILALFESVKKEDERPWCPLCAQIHPMHEGQPKL